MEKTCTSPEPFVTIKTVQHITGKSRSTIYRWIRDGLFPSSISIGPNSAAWSSEEVNEWVQRKLATPRAGYRCH